MKKVYIYISIAALLTSCEVAEQTNPPAHGSGALRIEACVADNITTRAAEESIKKTDFAIGDKITVNDDSQNTFVYTLGSTGWTPDDEALTVSPGGWLSFTATHKPTGEVMSPASGEFHLFVDELESWATTEGTSPTIVLGDDGYTANLSFTHTNALLSVRSVKQIGTGNTPYMITRIAFEIDTDGDGTADYTVGISGTDINLNNDGHVIAPAGKIVNASVTIKYPNNEKEYTASGITPTLIAGGMQHYVDFNITGEGLDVTVSTASQNWIMQPPTDASLTKEYNYIISSKADLIAYFSGRMTPSFPGTAKILQTADIDMSGELWRPKNLTYNEIYNGNGFTISNLKIDGNSGDAGFFGQLASGSVVTGLHLKGVDVTNSNTNSLTGTGGLAGFCDDGIISLCTVSGKVNGLKLTGGLVGRARNATITRCHAGVEVEGGSSNSFTGGLVGNAQSSGIVASSASGTVYSNGVTSIQKDAAGGLVGCMNGGYIFLSYATGAVSAERNYGGGLVGYIQNVSDIRGCYATGVVNGTSSSSGALVGYIENSQWVSSIKYCNAIPDNAITGKKFISNITGTPAECSDIVTERRATIGATAGADIVSDRYIKTTIWTTGYYGTTVYSRKFRSDAVWTEDDMPLINYQYNGYE